MKQVRSSTRVMDVTLDHGSIGDKIKGLYVDFNESILIFNDIFYATCFLILTLYLLCRSLSNFSAQRHV